MNYDCTEDTKAHINRVRELVENTVENLQRRAHYHDASKLGTIEKPIFDEMTPKLKDSTYGSEEYKGFLASMKPALDNHYKENRHHPEHHATVECIICFTDVSKFVNGRCPVCLNAQTGSSLPSLKGMTLLDLIEMLCDWKAAGERHANGSIVKSLEHNKGRFNISDEMQDVLRNTAIELGWINNATVEK